MPQARITSASRASPVLVLVGLSIVFLGCSDSRPTNPDRSPRNIVILCLDTLRADRMATYGHNRATTPRIDQLAERGAVFEHTLSQSNWTIPATASLLTSLYPSEHGAGVKHARGGIRNLDKSAVRRLRPDTRSLGQILSDAGFQTALLSANPYLVGRFKRGFELAHVERENATDLTDRALDFLDTIGENPFFLYIQYMDLHHPLVPPEPYLSLFGKKIPGERRDLDPDWRFRRHKNFQGTTFRRFRDHKLALYDGALRFLDGEIGRLLDAMEQLGLAEETLIILTSDHGEEFWDHARQERALGEDPRYMWGVGHGHSMYQELLWVPLILRGPGIGAGHRIQCPARLIDITPTVLDTLGLPTPDGMRGVSLHPLVAADVTSATCKPRVSLAESPAYGPDSKAIVYGKYKLVRRPNGFSQLFDLQADPRELMDLADVHPKVVAELTDLVEQELAGADESDSDDVMEFHSSTLQQLRALGYVD